MTTTENGTFLLKQGVQYIRPFFMTDSADHFSPKTGLTPVVTLSKAGGTFAAAGGVIAEIANGWYKITLSTTDTNTVGALVLHATSAGADNADWTDQVQTTILTDISVDASGNVSIASNVKKNQATIITFLMTDATTHAPRTGLTVTAQRSHNGGGYAPCSNLVAEIGSGAYWIQLTAADMNANTVYLRFSATGADDLPILILTQP